MGNLGVVPLLRSFAFLLTPIWARLFVRLLYVARFFDTITFPFPLPFLFASFFTVFGMTTIQGKTFPVKSHRFQHHSPFIVAPGEHGEIQIQHLRKFTVGDPHVISYQYHSSLKRLLFKGKRAGMTEIVIWTGTGGKGHLLHRHVYPVYVLSQKEEGPSLLPVGQLLQSMGLSIKWAKTVLVAQGSLKDVNSYRLLKKLQREYGQHLHLEGELALPLRNYIIGEAYYYLFEEKLDEVRCHHQNFDILCHYPSSRPPGAQVATYLKDRWGVTLMALDDKKARQGNLVAKFKIIQMERLDGEELGLGLDNLSGTLDDLFTGGMEAFVRKNQILLQSRRVHISTLAEPEVLLIPGETAEISVGAEIPFSAPSSASKSAVGVMALETATQWKFAGLKVKLQTKRIGYNSFELNYSTQFTRPPQSAQGAIGGSKERSSVAITLGHSLQLFQIGLQTTGKSTRGLPWAQDIPLLGHIFQSKSKQNNYKKISGVIILQRHGTRHSLPKAL